MHAAFGDRLRPPETLARLLGDGRLGRKNGRGFYRYHDGHKAGVDDSVYPLLGVRPVEDADAEVVERRLVYAMLNEAAHGAATRARSGARATATSARSSASASPPSAAARSA